MALTGERRQGISAWLSQTLPAATIRAAMLDGRERAGGTSSNCLHRRVSVAHGPVPSPALETHGDTQEHDDVEIKLVARSRRGAACVASAGLSCGRSNHQ